MCMEFQSYFQTKSTQLFTHWKNKALLPNIEKRDKYLGVPCLAQEYKFPNRWWIRSSRPEMLKY